MFRFQNISRHIGNLDVDYSETLFERLRNCGKELSLEGLF